MIVIILDNVVDSCTDVETA